MDEADIKRIERRLKKAQAAVLADEARNERRRAVMEAKAAGMTKYRIAQVMGVKGPTVDSIISSAETAAERKKITRTEWAPPVDS